MKNLPSIDREVSKKLAWFYRRCREHFGYAEEWWPGSPLDVAVTAIFVQQCDWSAARRAQLLLDDQGLLSLPQLARASEEDIADCLSGVTFKPTKARRLRRFAQRLLDQDVTRLDEYLARHPTDTMRCELLQFEGIGPETADCILAFAGNHAKLVIDQSLRRVFHRFQPAPQVPRRFWWTAYARVQVFLEAHILSDLTLYADLDFFDGVPRETALLRDFHAQILELGRHHCLTKNPLCNSQGARGWSDYDWCEGHCLSEICTQCPALDRCQQRPLDEN